jgi:hypothetical protein
MPKVLSSVQRYPYTRFSWIMEDRASTGSADASDLGLPAGAEPGSRVYADSADVGFVVMGERSDKLFLLVVTELVDADRTPGCWVFESEDGLHTVTVHND